jgi:hypothetical protein
MAASATLTWNPVLGATSYKVEYKLQSASTWTLFSNSVSATTCTITNLQEGSAYTFRISTHCSTGTSTGTTIDGDTPCKPVANLQVTISGTTANLQWDKKVNAVDYSIEYKLQSSSTWTAASGSPLSNSGAPNPVLFSIPGLSPGMAYDFRIGVGCLNSTTSTTTVSGTSACPNTDDLQLAFA